MTDTSTSDDARELNRLGYAQELFRTMGGFSNFAISFSIISVLTGAVTLYGYGLRMGGPFEMAVGWPLVAVGTLAVALSMAELASALPTSGSVYHWATKLGGRSWGWFTAWLNIAGNITVLAGVDYGCALFVTPLLGLQSTKANLLVVYACILVSHAIINHFGIRLVAWLNDFSVTVHIVGVVVIVGALLIFAPQKPVAFVLTKVSNNADGWPYWWAFILGLLQAQWTFTGYDASASVAEETVDPRRRAAWGMVLAVVVSGVVGYLLLIALTLSIDNIPDVLGATDSGGNEIPAVLTILIRALGSRAGTVFSWLTVMAMWFCGLSAVTWCSRVIYAFARDEGMPRSSLWCKVGSHQTPANAIWLSIAISFAAAVYSGAYAVVTSISVIALYASYIVPVFLEWKATRRGEGFRRGPFHLGKYGRVINVIALIWVVFISTILSLPDEMRAGKTILGLMALLSLWYALSKRHNFRGPAFAE